MAAVFIQEECTPLLCPHTVIKQCWKREKDFCIVKKWTQNLKLLKTELSSSVEELRRNQIRGK